MSLLLGENRKGPLPLDWFSAKILVDLLRSLHSRWQASPAKVEPPFLAYSLLTRVHSSSLFRYVLNLARVFLQASLRWEKIMLNARA